MQIEKEEIEATYNKATGWLSVLFPRKPDYDILQGLKMQGFRYEPYSKRWRASYATDREDHLKQLAGKIEEIDIKPNWAAKAEHAEGMAVKHAEKAESHFDTSHKILDPIPFGQPILVGHHSERAHRNALERADNHMKKGIEEKGIAENYEDRAQRYNNLAKGENPGVIYRRIQKLEADKRKMERELKAGETDEGTLYYSGHISQQRKDEIKRWIAHYESRLEVEREKYKVSGGIPTEKLTLKKGDRVKTRWGNGTLGSISQKTARVKLDGKDYGIYPNQKGESLLSKDDILAKL